MDRSNVDHGRSRALLAATLLILGVLLARLLAPGAQAYLSLPSHWSRTVPDRHGQVALAQADAPPAVEAGLAGGASYRLLDPVWQVSGSAAGEGFRLSAAGPSRAGQSCCCTTLPFVLRWSR